jgi:hypothetical protein
MVLDVGSPVSGRIFRWTSILALTYSQKGSDMLRDMLGQRGHTDS